MIQLIKRHLVVTISLALAITATAAAQAGVIPGVNEQQSQQPNVPTTQQLNGNGQAPADPQQPVQEAVPEEPAPDAPGDTTSTDEGGTPAEQPTPVTPSEPAPVATPQPPAPHQTGYTMRFVDVSPVDQPNTKAAEYCDYHYSDGSTVPTWVTTITKPAGFGQPIANYNESNPPSAYAPC